MRNHTISADMPTVNIQLLSNDNSYIIRGTGPDGYINKSILKDDPECQQKIRGLISSMYEFQQTQLANFIAEAPAQIEQQFSNLSAVLDNEFQPDNEEL